MTRTYKTFKDIQKFTVFVFSRWVQLLKYFFYVNLSYSDEGGGSLFLKTSRSKQIVHSLPSAFGFKISIYSYASVFHFLRGDVEFKLPGDDAKFIFELSKSD